MSLKRRQKKGEKKRWRSQKRGFHRGFRERAGQTIGGRFCGGIKSREALFPKMGELGGNRGIGEGWGASGDRKNSDFGFPPLPSAGQEEANETFRKNAP